MAQRQWSSAPSRSTSPQSHKTTTSYRAKTRWSKHRPEPRSISLLPLPIKSLSGMDCYLLSTQRKPMQTVCLCRWDRARVTTACRWSSAQAHATTSPSQAAALKMKLTGVAAPSTLMSSQSMLQAATTTHLPMRVKSPHPLRWDAADLSYLVRRRKFYQKRRTEMPNFLEYHNAFRFSSTIYLL